MSKLKAFKAYDIRGEWNTDFNAETVYKIGFFLPTLLKADNILVGRDCRLSSNEVFEALSAGITDAGAMVSDAAYTTTPMIYWGTARLGYPASVMITASHNPKSHNGLKISAADALPIGYDNGLDQLENMVINKTVNPTLVKAKVKGIDLIKPYLKFLDKYKADISQLRVGIDCSNGMASILIKQLLQAGHVYYINDRADGEFPGHDPNPLEPENQEQIKQLVKEYNCDVGLIFDGDADRVMFIDEKGGFVSPDLMIALLGHYFFEEKKQKGLVLQDIRSSKAIAEYLAQFGATVETWRVGRAYGALKLRQIDGVFGGELAGHYYFRDFYYSDSGMMAALIVLNLLNRFKKLGLSLSQLIARISSYHNSGEINFKIKDKPEAMNAVKAYFLSKGQPMSFMDFDGYRLDYEDFWFNIRPSNTEPYLRFLAEAKSQQKLDEIVKKVKEIVGRFE
jgi:phosphomannomutase